MCHVVMNANREVLPGFGVAHLVKNAPDHGGREFLRREAVTPTNDTRERRRVGVTPALAESGGDIQVERFADTARFFCAVKRGENFDGGWERLYAMFHR